jgi:hypothetical protein
MWPPCAECLDPCRQPVLPSLSFYRHKGSESILSKTPLRTHKGVRRSEGRAAWPVSRIGRASRYI